ncbi:hypothetical protein ACFLXC_03365 [Chloroflexota bacterium]
MVIFYTIALVITLVVIHEAAHILTAMSCGVRLSELKVGFMGINPSIRLPPWFTGGGQTSVHYAGGLASGAALLLLHLFYWMPAYRRNPTFLFWSLGLITFALA